jgi:uncharacterized phage protein (TIGR01671 family)
MREIKFRGKRTGTWHYFDLTGSTGWAKELLNLIGDQESAFVFDTPLEQYTGLKDRNGKEIYEGDIVRSHNGALMGVVIYQAPAFVIKRNARAKTWGEFILAPQENQFQEVIGNVHENPELIEQSDTSRRRV